MGLGIVLALLKFLFYTSCRKQGRTFSISLSYKKTCDIKKALLSENVMVNFGLFSFFVLLLITLTMWGYGYEWAFYVADPATSDFNTLKEALIITPVLHTRYLIPLRLFLWYPLVYPLLLLYRGLCTQNEVSR
jgi:hypothetical protein